jgi:hypothetical protein
VRSAETRQAHLIKVALSRARLSEDELWMRYFALGGRAGPVEVQAFLEGSGGLEPLDGDLLAHAVNERLDDLHWRHRAPYSRPVREGRPESGPLAALIELLRGAHLAPPDRLPQVVDAAARLLGVRGTLYLVDYPMTELIPFSSPSTAGGARTHLSLDSTLAGRAFRLLTTQVSGGEEPRLWVPVIDGLERLGVLDVTVADERDLVDPTLREQVWWLAHYVGHLLTAVGAVGDGLDAVRRRRPRSIAAELIWQLLPPLTGGTDKVIVSGGLEPNDSVGGDVFDYALTESTAHLAILDATGHDLSAGLVAATALSAYRNARREGRSLFDQADLLNRALMDQFAGETFATGVLARLDLNSGRLRYISAGHPYPLILRRGHVVKELRRGRRTLFGLEASHIEIGQEQLEPGDVLVLYTDGITEARDAAGVPFGVTGLTQFIEREFAVQTPLPEVVRRLCKLTLDRQGGFLEDDTTILMAHWTTEGQAHLEPGPLR